jgi:chemotaxis protein MotB
MNREREIPIRIVYRKKGHGHGHHGGAWKVAFADFMTAMFALFLVLWLTAQTTDIKSAVAGYFQDPLGRADEHGSSILPGEGAQAAVARPLTQIQVLDVRRDRLASFAERLRDRLDSIPALSGVQDQIEVTLAEDGLRIELVEDSVGVFFDTGSPHPSGRGRLLLGMLGRELGTIPNEVRIDGYTDARPYRGDGRYTNWELSADRANAARRILTAEGLDPARLDQVRGFADRRLRVPSDPLAASNRRISITLLFPDTAHAGADAPPAGPRDAAPDAVAPPAPHHATPASIPAAAGGEAR